MGGLSAIEAVASGGGWALAIAVAATALVRFVKWLIEFICERLERGDKRLAQRLKHVELELDAYRVVAMVLIGVVAKIDPDNPALVNCARILRTHPPRSTIELDELTERLNDIPAKGEGNEGIA